MTNVGGASISPPTARAPPCFIPPGSSLELCKLGTVSMATLFPNLLPDLLSLRGSISLENESSSLYRVGTICP